VAASVAGSLALALHNARGTSYFKKISLSCPNPICFPCVPKGQKAKQLVSCWREWGKALAIKSESRMQQDGVLDTWNSEKSLFLKINPNIYFLGLSACFQFFFLNTASKCLV